MARARRDERLLSKDEQELVAQTRHPIIETLDSAELLNIIKRLRERHDRAREIGSAKPALPTKKAADTDTPQPSTHTPYQDMQPVANTDIPPLDALKRESPRPALERSHKVR
jgi:hypothetical protein